MHSRQFAYVENGFVAYNSVGDAHINNYEKPYQAASSKNKARHENGSPITNARKMTMHIGLDAKMEQN